MTTLPCCQYDLPIDTEIVAIKTGRGVPAIYELSRLLRNGDGFRGDGKTLAVNLFEDKEGVRHLITKRAETAPEKAARCRRERVRFSNPNRVAKVDYAAWGAPEPVAGVARR